MPFSPKGPDALEKSLERLGEDIPDDPLPLTDDATWATVRSLIVVLRKKGVLDAIGMGDLCEEILRRSKMHADRGEPKLADQVRDAAEKVALITADHD